MIKKVRWSGLSLSVAQTIAVISFGVLIVVVNMMMLRPPDIRAVFLTVSPLTPDCCMAAEQLKEHPRHRDYLEAVSQGQLEKLHILLQDHLRGLSLKHSLSTFHLDPDEDLNKLDDKELARKKAQMDREFERNRKHKDDPGFVYDLEVDFEKAPQENCSWDESDDGF